MEVLHLDYRPGTAGWVLQLQSRLAASDSEVVRARYSRWREVGLAELGLAVATRFALTLRVPAHLGELLKTLRDEIEESGRLDELLHGRSVFTPKDQRILYDICVSVDAFYSEYRSCYEVVGRFAKLFAREILDRKVTEADLFKVVTEAGVDTEWIEPVRENRKLFFHETAPWIALEVHKRHPLECSLLVMKENVQDFEDPEAYVTQQDLVKAIEGLQGAMSAVQHWLAEQVTEAEESAS